MRTVTDRTDMLIRVLHLRIIAHRQGDPTGVLIAQAEALEKRAAALQPEMAS